MSDLIWIMYDGGPGLGAEVCVFDRCLRRDDRFVAGHATGVTAKHARELISHASKAWREPGEDELSGLPEIPSGNPIKPVLPEKPKKKAKKSDHSEGVTGVENGAAI
jgi:hypothetical protein